MLRPQKQQVDQNDDPFSNRPAEQQNTREPVDMRGMTDAALDRVRETARTQAVTDRRVQVRADGTITVGNLLLTAKGIEQAGVVSLEDMESAGRLLRNVGERYNILIGDFLVRAELVWGKADYKKALAALGYEYGSLRNFKMTMSKIPMSLRDDNLNYNHYYVAATKLKTEADRKKWLKRAVQEGWSYRTLQDEIAKTSPTDSSYYQKVEKSLVRQRKTYLDVIANASSIGGSDAVKLSQIIDVQIAELENLKRAVLNQ